MPYQNRVTPYGELVATAARGTLMGMAAALHQATGFPLAVFDQLDIHRATATVRGVLGATSFDAAWAAGWRSTTRGLKRWREPHTACAGVRTASANRPRDTEGVSPSGGARWAVSLVDHRGPHLVGSGRPDHVRGCWRGP